MKAILLILAFTTLFVGPVQAQKSDIETAIAGQLDAFDNDDFLEAFAYASPHIQKMFRDSTDFEQMVKRGYPMVHKKKSFEFKELIEIEGVYYQLVLIEDIKGAKFMLRYAMVQTSAGWRIDGVQLFAPNSVEA